ncbi:hypothetical protein BOTBODRAFT_35400 [Botryobasidium botryosum FD-172 SS1]|uniref:Uncharacterized protein n=1 Tax=Botryobasidium botryosum (strain FD-172 SS1) TaxID=930990 RepID=A0A067MIG1_BOTB1|nr:hypothetical protein BOTBODRAFT_35400 [Botryobasidium botryosum FD-172 SS1]
MSTNVLQDGRYRIRSVSTSQPNPGVGGMFATANGPAQDLTAVAAVPEYFENQTWAIEKYKDVDFYTIKWVEKDTTSEEEGFSYDKWDQDAPITLGAPGDFTLEQVPGTDAVYIIRPVEAKPVVGVDVCVGTGEGNKIVIKHVILAGPSSTETTPAWGFYRLD